MNLFWERNRGRTICVTGSNGKSTTTALIHDILAQQAATSEFQAPHFGFSGPVSPVPAYQGAGTDRGVGPPRSPVSSVPGAAQRVWLGGNIGKSLLPVVDQIEATDWVVLELSSFQLEDL